MFCGYLIKRLFILTCQRGFSPSLPPDSDARTDLDKLLLRGWAQGLRAEACLWPQSPHDPAGSLDLLLAPVGFAPGSGAPVGNG
jgi:hypothetical protein